MKIAIAQPTYFPWIGYYDLMDQADVFVLLDHVQFEKQSWQQRNRIKTPTGLQWLSVPVKISGRSTQSIQDVEMADRTFFRKHLNIIRANYRNAPYFPTYIEPISGVLEKYGEAGSLAELNVALIELFAAILQVQTRRIRSSTLDMEGKRSLLNLAICERLGGNEYLSAIGSANYLLPDLKLFSDSGIQVSFHNYIHPQYSQCFPPFCPYASILDLVLNEGPNSMAVVRKGRHVPLTPTEVQPDRVPA